MHDAIRTDPRRRGGGHRGLVRLRYDLIGSAGVRAVYDRLHVELAGDGWRRTELDVERDEIDAEYRRAGWELEVEVEERGRDRVRVMLERDD